MEKLIHFFILIPLIGFIISLIMDGKKENTISAVAFSSVGINFFSLIVFTVLWIFRGLQPLNLSEINIYTSGNYQFLLDFYFDKITAVYLMVGAFLTFLVTVYSRYYLHRERGYKRFFNTVLFFYMGYNITVLSGNFETLFLGWEILGVSSFLLIGFYRERYLPVKNAVKVFSIYRIGDLGILLVMWLSHILWHENITFMKLNNRELVHEHLMGHTAIGVMIAVMILVSAAAKSAQFPFSSWLPRAMEGPTPSSAIFYGSLSVHMGVFLMLRTYPFWQFQYTARVIIALTGLVTAIVSGLTARVQTSVKAQVAYASSAQLGLIFIEVALGFETLALFHFAGNAFLRTYQLLVSPSVVSYLIREQFYHFEPRKQSSVSRLPKKLQYSLYMLSLKEWNLDWFMSQYIWQPLKLGGKLMHKLPQGMVYILFFVALYAGLILYGHQNELPWEIRRYIPESLAFLGLLFVLRSFSTRKSAIAAWTFILMNNALIALAISFNEHIEYTHIIMYLSGIVVAGSGGYLIMAWLKNKEQEIDLKQFYGHSYHYPVTAFLFLLCALTISGFPISPTFIGEDLIYSHIEAHQSWLALIVSMSFIVDGLSLVRIYARLFLGMHVKRFHEVGFRSS